MGFCHFYGGIHIFGKDYSTQSKKFIIKGGLTFGSASLGESCDLPKGTPGVDISELGNEETAENPSLNIAKMEVLLNPIEFVILRKTQ